MASDEHVATALREFAKALLEGSRNSARTAHGNPLSEERQRDRRKRFEGALRKRLKRTTSTAAKSFERTSTLCDRTRGRAFTPRSERLSS